MDIETAAQMISPDEMAAMVIRGARRRADNPDELDFRVKVEGIQRYGYFWEATIEAAQDLLYGGEPARGEDQAGRRRELAHVLWEQIQPGLKAYEADCKAARFGGWSAESAARGRTIFRMWA